jgi:hypothetical protein
LLAQKLSLEHQGVGEVGMQLRGATQRGVGVFVLTELDQHPGERGVQVRRFRVVQQGLAQVFVSALQLRPTERDPRPHVVLIGRRADKTGRLRLAVHEPDGRMPVRGHAGGKRQPEANREETSLHFRFRS